MNAPAHLKSVVASTEGGKGRKLAERIAREISDRILGEAQVRGAALGTEAELLSVYGSSRSTIREAIAILEREGVVDVRRGRGGGLFVGAPDLPAASHALRTFFEYLKVDATEIMDTRRVLNALAIRLAVERLKQEHIVELRKPGVRFWRVLRAAGNPVLEMFARAASRLEVLALLRSRVTEAEYFDFLDESFAFQAREAEAIIGARLQEALEIESECLHKAEAFMARLLREQHATPQSELVDRLEIFVGKQRPLKKPERVYYALMSDILDLGWELGHHLGSERDMLERYAVGRSVFRETIRPMEQFGIVEMRTGRVSGLKIAAPSAEMARAEVSRQLQLQHVPEADYAQVYQALGASVAANATHIGVGFPAASDTRENGQGRLNALLAEGGGNRMMSVMLGILAPAVTPPKASMSQYDMLFSAIEAGDRSLAYRSFLLLYQHN